MKSREQIAIEALPRYHPNQHGFMCRSDESYAYCQYFAVADVRAALPPPAQGSIDAAVGYRAGSVMSMPDGTGKVTLHYESINHAVAVYDAITGNIDAHLADRAARQSAAPELLAAAQRYLASMDVSDITMDFATAASATEHERARHALLKIVNAAPAPSEPEEHNFCERCGKRVHAGSIHTCTPPAPSDAIASVHVVPQGAIGEVTIFDSPNDVDWYGQIPKHGTKLYAAPSEPVVSSATVPQGVPDEVTQDHAVLLAGVQALCISANQECTRQGGSISDFDKGWFTGQLHMLDMHTRVEKSAIAEAREYIEKLSAAAPTATSGGEAVDDAQKPAAWMNPSEGWVKDAFIWQQDALREPQFSVPVYIAPPPLPATDAASVRKAVLEEVIQHHEELARNTSGSRVCYVHHDSIKFIRALISKETTNG